MTSTSYIRTIMSISSSERIASQAQCVSILLHAGFMRHHMVRLGLPVENS